MILSQLILAGIVEYMRKQIGDASREFPDNKELKTMLKYMDDVFIVGFFENQDDELYENYMEAGQ